MVRAYPFMGIRRRNADGSRLWEIAKVPFYGRFLRIDPAFHVIRRISGSQIWEALEVPVYGAASCLPNGIRAQSEAVVPACKQDEAVGKVAICGISGR